MSEKKYPIKDGWLHGKIGIQPGHKFRQEDILKLFGIKNTDQYEVAKFKHYKTVIRIIFRRNRKDG